MLTLRVENLGASPYCCKSAAGKKYTSASRLLGLVALHPTVLQSQSNPHIKREHKSLGLSHDLKLQSHG